MCYAGAREETALQMRGLLNLDNLNDQQILELNEKFIENVNSSLNGDVSLKTANKLYPNLGFEIVQQYLDTVQKHFKSSVQQLDYNNSEESAKTINDWVLNETNQKIKDLIQPSILNSLTRLVLVNAIYFKGNWQTKFKPESTTQENFHLADGTVQKVDMMKLNNKKFKYQYRPGAIDANTCELPYVGDKVSMTIILPHEGYTLEHVEKQLTSDLLNEVLTADAPKEAMRLHVPKFKLEYKTELSDHFKSLGATLPFDQSRANFTGISTDPNGLYISKVVHQAVVEVNEEGTEAAAATGIVMMTRCAVMMEPFDFICNRPFLFMIHEKNHNSILFFGKYAKPQ